MKKKISVSCVILLSLFLFSACVPSSPQSINIDNKTLQPDNIQLKKGVDLIDGTYNLLLDNYVDPVSPYVLIIGFVKGIEKYIGTTKLLYQSADSYVVLSPTTNSPIPENTSRGEALKAIREIYQFYVHNEIDKEPLSLASEATKGMVSNLDPHSDLLSPEAYKELRIDTEGKFTGIGIHVTMRDGFVTVVSPIEGTPAYNAGIKAKDRINTVDGVETTELRDAVKRMRGPKGTPVLVTVLREGEPEPIEFRLIRDIIPIDSIKVVSIKPGYNYVRITNFRQKTTNDLLSEYKNLESNTFPIKGLILDLRDNPGGILSQAISISDLFIDRGTILSIKGRLNKHSNVFKAHVDRKLIGFPVIVLINGGSASASEIVAGALKDHKRALLLGTRTFGKGSVQTVESLKDGFGIKYTIARYYTPSGAAIQAKGIEPDILLQRKESNQKETNIEAEKVLREEDLSGHLQPKSYFDNKSNDEQIKVNSMVLENINKDYQVISALKILENTKSSTISDLMVSARKYIETERVPSVNAIASNKAILSASTINPDAVAVVIGNQTYSHKDIPPVKFANNDASAIKQYLIGNLGYKDGNIIYEADTSKAELEMIFGTEKNHRGMLYNYIKPKKSDVFIYYSGHGSPDPNTNKAYLVPTDCNPVMMDLTAYPLDVLYGNLPKIEAKSVTVVIDACFSGGTNTGKWLVPNASPALIKIKNPVTMQNNLTIFTSAENNQVSSWYPEKQHSMFTYFFMRAVTGDADFNKDKQITFQEIYNFVADRAEGVPYYAKRLHGGRIQTPTMRAANKDAVFVRY